MELILLIFLIVVISIIWGVVSVATSLSSHGHRLDDLTRERRALGDQVDGLIRRGRASDEKLAQLEASLAELRSDVAGLKSARPPAVERPKPAIAPAAAPKPAIAPAAASVSKPVAAAPKAAPAPTAPGPVPGWAAPAAPPPVAGRPGPAVRPPAPEPTPEVPWAPPVVRAPEGPSLSERLLVALGMEPSTTGMGPSRGAVEAWLEGRMLAVVGGIALVLGAVFFLSLAFSRGWITEPMRVGAGLLFGAGLLVLGEVAFSRLRGVVGPVLVAVGLAFISLALFAATRLYGLVAVEWGLAGAFVAAVAAAVIAIRHDSQLVAAFGLIAVLAAPPVLGASPNLVTLLFVAATLVGTTVVALFRTWTWLPPLAFVLAAPQVASYVVGGPPVVEGLIAVAGFWLVNVVAAGGEEARHATGRLRTATVTLLLADAAFTLWAGFTILSGPYETWRGAFLAVGALLYLALGLFFLVRDGDRHPFGLVVAATGVAALTMAVPVQAGGPPVPIAWAAEAVALAWVAVLRRHPYSAAVSVLLGAMALAHLVAVEYPPAELATGLSRTVPFVGPEGLTFVFMIAALVAAGLLIPIAWARVGLASVGGLLAIYVFPFELSGPALVAGWSAIAAAGTVLLVRVVMRRVPVSFRERRTAALALPASIARPVAEAVEGLSAAVTPIFAMAALLAAAGVLAHLVWFDYPFGEILVGTPHAVPFVGLPGLSFAIVLVALAVVGVLVAIPWIRVALLTLGGVIALYVFPFELSGPSLVWAWAALATAAFVIEAQVIQPRLDVVLAASAPGRLARPTVPAVGALAGIAVLGHLLVLDFPMPDVGKAILSSPPYIGPEGLSLAAALLALVLSGWMLRARWVRLGMTGIGLALLAYTVTFEVGQPATTVAWAALTLASVALVRRVAPVRLVVTTVPWNLEMVSERLPYVAGALALGFLAVRASWLADPYGFAQYLTGRQPLAGTPFLDERTFVLLLLAATLAAVGWLWGGVMARVWGVVAAGVVVAWLLPFEVRAAYAVAGWCALALAGMAIIRVVPAARTILGAVSLSLGTFAALVAFSIVAPPDRLIVDASTTVAKVGILTDATIALGALAIALAVGSYLHRTEQLALPAMAAAGVVVVYLLSVAVVDWFQLQVGTRPIDELQKEASVALSVLWSVLGGIVFAAGLVTRRTPVRLFGLALLGLATVKVFLVDLAALDIAYRVLSLVALGVLLLISAAVYSRIQHPHGPVSPRHA